MRNVIATKSTSLALAEERKLMRQGYEFLDEKRMLLAGEILRLLTVYKAFVERMETARRAAAAALAATIERHGLDRIAGDGAADCPATAAVEEVTVPAGGTAAHPRRRCERGPASARMGFVA